MKKLFNISFRCHYNDGSYTSHRQDIALKEIPKWIDSYKFTHPLCIAISFKLWFDDNAE